MRINGRHRQHGSKLAGEETVAEASPKYLLGPPRGASNAPRPAVDPLRIEASFAGKERHTTKWACRLANPLFVDILRYPRQLTFRQPPLSQVLATGRRRDGKRRRRLTDPARDAVWRSCCRVGVVGDLFRN